MWNTKIKIKRFHSDGWKYVWAQRRLLTRLTVIAVLVGVVITLSLPAEYEARVFTLSEARVVYADARGVISTNRYSGGERIRDAVLPSLYRRVMASPTFLLPYSRTLVRLSDRPDSTLTLYEYVSHHWKRPWWTSVLNAPFRLVGFVRSAFRGSRTVAPDSVGGADVPASVCRPGEVVRLTRRDASVMARLRRCIDMEIDADKQSVTLIVRMQDPLVAAIAADSLLEHIQTYITDYRTGKERRQLAENEALLEQARREYHQAQDELARCQDANNDLVSTEARSHLVSLQVRLNQTLREYQRVESLVQAGRRRVATWRPVLTVIQAPEVPRRPASPSALRIIGVCLLLAWAGALGWLWLKKKRFVIRWHRRKRQGRRRIVLFRRC